MPALNVRPDPSDAIPGCRNALKRLRPPTFSAERYSQRNTIERLANRRKQAAEGIIGSRPGRG
ncbi:hypothetical protein GCM10017581_011100 [Dactylosporangium matsuzakiense]|uniref:Transposase n=1 Tax=Dactylosporangium matsuzakiense TaxID=53360 RepID=A0A9W6KEV6_9ACTN|nr:hypothetical protein GCM10017581_011100 [Dactylosporangium matsuzakiense]